MQTAPASIAKRPQGAFTLVEILIVVAIIGLIASIAIPNFIRSRAIAQRQLCIENLAQIESAKQIWGLENSKKNGEVVTDADLFGPNLHIKAKPECPLGGTYDLKLIGETATCSISGHAL